MRERNVWWRWSRALAVGIVAAGVAGAASGAVARALMRAVTVLTGGDPHFSWSGTLAILVVYVLALLPGAVAAAGGLRRTGRFLLALGATLLVVEGVAIAAQEDVGMLFGGGAWRAAGSVAVLLGFPLGVTAQVAAVVLICRRLGRRARQLPAAVPEPASV